MKTMNLKQFNAELHAQGVPEREDYAFVCPMCKTVQSARDLISAGAGRDFDDVRRYVGFSCVGRFTGHTAPRAKPDGQPCNWTLGGLFQMHELEIEDAGGVRHPHFAPATPVQALAHLTSQGGAA